MVGLLFLGHFRSNLILFYIPHRAREPERAFTVCVRAKPWASRNGSRKVRTQRCGLTSGIRVHSQCTLSRPSPHTNASPKRSVDTSQRQALCHIVTSQLRWSPEFLQSWVRNALGRGHRIKQGCVCSRDDDGLLVDRFGWHPINTLSLHLDMQQSRLSAFRASACG